MNETQESAIADFLQILEEHRKNCVRQGKYVEADVAKNRIDELKSHEANRRLEAMKDQHEREKLGVEEAHMLEFQQFNLMWDKKSKEYQQQCDDQVNMMMERHKHEIKEYQRKLLERQQKPKLSSVLLNYRKIEEHLARAKNYSEAHKMKSKADRLEEKEIEEWNKQKQKEMLQQEHIFRAAKKQEFLALQKRVETGKKELDIQRRLALERLTQRCHNVKSELEKSHTRELIARKQALGIEVTIDRRSSRI